MYKPKQGKRLLLKSLVALGVLGAIIPSEAEANPLVSMLRFASAVSIGIQLDDWYGGVHHNEAHADSTEQPLYQTTNTQRSLVLQIPPVSKAICAEVLIFAVDLNTGIPLQVARTTLSVLPSQHYEHHEILLQALPQQGLFQFEAVIPELAHAIYIESTEPVLLL